MIAHSHRSLLFSCPIHQTRVSALVACSNFQSLYSAFEAPRAMPPDLQNSSPKHDGLFLVLPVSASNPANDVCIVIGPFVMGWHGLRLPSSCRPTEGGEAAQPPSLQCKVLYTNPNDGQWPAVIGEQIRSYVLVNTGSEQPGFSD